MFEPFENYLDHLSIDCVIFGYHNRTLKILVPQLKTESDIWTLPGGFIKEDEDIDQAAKRILAERTGLEDIYLEQFRVFGKANRKNSMVLDAFENSEQDLYFDKQLMDEPIRNWLSGRFISIGYYALVDMDKVVPKRMPIDKKIAWYALEDLPRMIMDHNQQVTKALDVLREQLDSKLLGFNLLPDTFTMKEVQEVYETIHDQKFTRSNFQSKMLSLGVLERLEKKYTGASNRAPYLYRFKK
ncbi:NrtR DNA-binding winged helix domain-containing protein [Allomuricauda sp. NBRC 101325]|uniref:NUDIX hydrolase n=1 Tax=Allomuricauda sp. NBRC 101325 TaxID=1113758 RepID=UPI0024A4A1CF|nr:NUDIX domain-containing protein [Muricauda sp. NBRC 101325]GLU45177.1 DNA mismatch repair protein MutT [Muricauda sp. NBRC 101325]